MTTTLPPSPPPCLRCWFALLLIGAAVVASFAYLGIDYRALGSAESLRLMGKFVAEFFPPDVSPDFLAKVGRGALQTLAVSALGTVLAALRARCWRCRRRAARAGGATARASCPQLPAQRARAGVGRADGAGRGHRPVRRGAGLSLHTTGVLGRLFAEALENAPREPEHALTLSGAGPVAAFSYASLPIVLPQWVAYTLYRWEMNIRMAAVLGFVGGGGLGQLLYFHLSIFQQQQAMTVLIAMFVLVTFVDFASARLRRGLGPAYA
jgi:phosphonate transport system permease protein